MSALATIVGSLGELSESELRQLYLMVGVRLGIPDVPPGEPPRGRAPTKRRVAGPSGPKSGGKGGSSKGNPQRKSQWANHPLYQEYSRLKKVVEAQAKEAKTSFNSVDTAESRAYRKAFSDWLEAKSSFRDHRGSGQDGPVKTTQQDPSFQAKLGKGKIEEEESSSEEEEEGETAPPSPRKQTKSASPPAAAGSSGKTGSPPAGKRPLRK